MHITVFQSNAPILQVPLADQSLSIGRGPNNDLCLLDPFISRNHALIQKQANQWIITDRSKNGLLINGKKLQSATLIQGCTIEIGPYTLSLEAEVFANEPTKIIQHNQQTQAFSYQPKSSEVLIEQAWLQQILPLKRKHPIQKTSMTLGKDPQNDLIIEDEYISNFHCKITKKENGFVLLDLSSTNGTFVNDQKVIEMPLENQAQIQIGKARFTFCTQTEKKKIVPVSEDEFCGILSKNHEMKKVFSLIESLAPIDASVYIHGETGTGKELIARAIAQKSHRAHKPFLTVNCGAIAKDLIESELFGHEKGAFTSAHQQRKGLFEQADKGTIFLDEIGELPLDLQPKLLRVLETGEIRRVGSDQNLTVDVRIISATHRDLQQEVAQNRFRQDLLYRLLVIPIELPPLRKRPEDLALLAEYFLKQSAQSFKQPVKTISKKALELLKSHTWPGNIRELKNIIQRALIVGHASKEIDANHIDFLTAPNRLDAKEGTLADIEKEAILIRLKQNQWNKTKTAKDLGIAKSTLHAKIQFYDLTQESL